MKLYKLVIKAGYEDDGYYCVDKTFCGVFDSRDKAEACLKEIQGTEEYDFLLNFDIFEEEITEIEVNKCYWKKD